MLISRFNLKPRREATTQKGSSVFVFVAAAMPETPAAGHHEEALNGVGLPAEDDEVDEALSSVTHSLQVEEWVVRFRHIIMQSDVHSVDDKPCCAPYAQQQERNRYHQHFAIGRLRYAPGCGCQKLPAICACLQCTIEQEEL
eukprot:scpid68057/ scgid35202/ 